MNQLPLDFAELLARVLEPGQEKQVGEIIEAATGLDDEALRQFLERFAARVRQSPEAIKAYELLSYLRASERGGQSTET